MKNLMFVVGLVAMSCAVFTGCKDAQPPVNSAIDEPDAQVQDTEKKKAVIDETEVTKEIETVKADRPKRTKNPDHDKEMEKRIAPLYWLADHQNEDGSWSADFHENCGSSNKNLEVKIKREGVCKNEDGSDDSGHSFSNELLTGLTLLTFLGCGYTHEDGEFKSVVKEGLRFLMKAQHEDGCFAENTDVYQMMTHAICTLAIAEAYAMTANAILKRHSKGALKYLVDSQCKDGDGKYTGWSRTDNKLNVDPMATSWAFLALKNCRFVALEVPEHCWEGIGNYFKSITTIKDGVAFVQPETDFMPKGSEKFEKIPLLNAVYAFYLQYIGTKRSDDLYVSVIRPLKNSKNFISVNDSKRIDFMYWHFDTYAMNYHRGMYFEEWKRSLFDTATEIGRFSEKDEGKCVWGSVDPVDVWGNAGGRVYSTAIVYNILSWRFRDFLIELSYYDADDWEGISPNAKPDTNYTSQKPPEAEKKTEDEDWEEDCEDW